MATMKVCRSCDEVVEEHLPICPRCRASITGADLLVDDQSVGPDEARSDPTIDPEKTSGTGLTSESRNASLPAVCREPGCGAELPDGEEFCSRCGAPVTPMTAPVSGRPLVLSIGGESVALPPGVTRVGREGPLGRLLRKWPNVSRRHAEIVVEASGGEAVISDSNSVNGTFVDGRRLSDGEVATLHEGMEIRLAREATIRVEAGPDGA